MQSYSQQAAEKYNSVELRSRIEKASPHELINLLYQEARKHMNMAKHSMQRQEIQKKGDHIGMAISILEELRASLDHEQGGEIATNLEKLYAHVQVNLLKANMQNSIDLLNESNRIIGELNETWQAIAPKAASATD